LKYKNDIKPSYILTAEKLFEEFKMNPGKADSKYADKYIQVDGLINEFRFSNKNEKYVSLLGKENETIYGIKFIFDSDIDEDDLSKLEKNLKVSIIGKYNSFDALDVILTDSRFIKVNDNSLNYSEIDYTMSADKFYNDCKSGLGQKKDTYLNKTFKIHGEFKRIISVDENFIKISLKAGDSWNETLICYMLKSESNALQEFNENEKISIIGKFIGSTDFIDLSFRDCIIDK